MYKIFIYLFKNISLKDTVELLGAGRRPLDQVGGIKELTGLGHYLAARWRGARLPPSSLLTRRGRSSDWASEPPCSAAEWADGFNGLPRAGPPPSHLPFPPCGCLGWRAGRANPSGPAEQSRIPTPPPFQDPALLPSGLVHVTGSGWVAAL